MKYISTVVILFFLLGCKSHSNIVQFFQHLEKEELIKIDGIYYPVEDWGSYTVDAQQYVTLRHSNGKTFKVNPVNIDDDEFYRIIKGITIFIEDIEPSTEIQTFKTIE